MRRTLRSLIALAAIAGGCSHSSSTAPTARLLSDQVEGLVLSAAVMPDTGEVFFTDGNRLMRWDGTWCHFAAPTDRILRWVWGASSRDVYAGGDRLLLHWDGSRWTEIPTCLDESEAIWGVWGSGPDDVWAVGGDMRTNRSGFLLRGSAAKGFQRVVEAAAQSPLYKVWGCSASDVWIVGSGGQMVHWDGHGYSRSVLSRPDLDPSQQIDTFFTVSGRACNDVWVVGGNQNGLVLHFDGKQWSFAGESGQPPYVGVWTAPGEDVFVVGWQGAIRRLGASGWVHEDLPGGPDFHGVVGLGGGRVFAVGGQLFALSNPSGAIAYRSVDPLPPMQLANCPELPDGEEADASALVCQAVDASEPRDMAVRDLATRDGGVDMTPADLSQPSDLSGIQAGQPCPEGTGCAGDLGCWEIGFGSGYFVCTHHCDAAKDCGPEFGAHPSCCPPGCQVAPYTTCIPEGHMGCGC